MARRVRLSSALVEYEGPQVVLGEDEFGARYVGLLVEQGQRVDTFMLSSVTPERLSELVSGQVDLRLVFEHPEEGVLHSLEWSPASEDQWVALGALANVPENWLPETGFMLSSFLPSVTAQDTDLKAEALARNRAVVHLAIGPHSGTNDPLIAANELSSALSTFQQLVRQAFSRAIRNLDQQSRARYADPDNHALEVYSFSPGSFRVHMQAGSTPDLFGGVSIERAFERIDAMTAAIDSPEKSLEAVRENQGHLASAYSKLLAFVKDSNESLSYGWTTPESEVTRRSVSPQQAASVLALLEQENELESEWREIIGVFTKVNTKTGSWTLEDAAGRESRGSLHDEADDLLSGVVVKETTYKLVCEEVLAETMGTGRHKTNLRLRHLETHE